MRKTLPSSAGTYTCEVTHNQVELKKVYILQVEGLPRPAEDQFKGRLPIPASTSLVGT